MKKIERVEFAKQIADSALFLTFISNGWISKPVFDIVKITVNFVSSFWHSDTAIRAYMAGGIILQKKFLVSKMIGKGVRL